MDNREVETRVRKNGRKDKVIIEKSAAEGLPEGWIKKLVITNRTGRKVRRDPFFIDPKSGYIFQSFKDASRYVETGNIGSYARKLKENDIQDDDSGRGKTFLPRESVEKEEKINIYFGRSKGRNISSSDEHPENCELNSSLCSVKSQVPKDPIENQPVAKRITRSQAKANRNKEDLDLKTKNVSSSNAKSGKEMESVVKKEGVEDSTETWITRSKAKGKKNEISNSVVHRASKRLAGMELEPTPELKTRTKAQRIVAPDVGTSSKCKQPVNHVATGDLEETDTPLSKEVAKNNEHSSPKPNAAAKRNNCVSAEMQEQIEKMIKPVGRNVCGDKKKMKTPVVISEAELNPVFHLDGYKAKEEMWPLSHQSCAAKCEKTAGLQRMGRSSPKAKHASEEATEISPLRSSKKGNRPCDNGSNTIHRRDNLGNESSKVWEEVEKKSNSVSSALADMWKDPCIAFAIKTLTGESLHLPSTAAISSDPQNNQGVAFCPETPRNESAYTELPGADIWNDPCIDFAIKTLMGAIPIGLDESDVKSKSEGTTITAAPQQCSNNMKNKTVGNCGDQRFTLPFPFSKD